MPKRRLISAESYIDVNRGIQAPFRRQMVSLLVEPSNSPLTVQPLNPPVSWQLQRVLLIFAKMRVHHILVVILIAREISGFRPGSDAYPSIIGMLERVPELHLVFDRNIFEWMESIVNDVRMNNKGFCDDIRGPVGPRLQSLLDDIHSLVNITQLEGDTTAAVSQGKWDTYFNHYCQKVPTFIEIIENATILMKPCLPLWLQPSYFQLQYNSTSLFSRIRCHNGGNNTASFMNNGGVECLASNQEAIRLCDRESLLPYYTLFKNGQLILLFNLGLEKCRDVEKYRNCIVTALRTCQHPEPATALDSMFGLHNSWADCQGILGSDASNTYTGDVAGGQL